MRIRIHDISPDGLEVSDTISLEALNARMNEAKDNDIIFTSPPKVALRVFKSPMGAETKGSVTAKYTQPCALCVEGCEREAVGSLDYIFQVAPAGKSSNHHSDDFDDEGELFDSEDLVDDIGIVFFEGDHIEIEPLAQEALILALDPFWHPECDSSGCCMQCGKTPEAKKSVASINEDRVTFADLLKRAKSE